MMDWEQQLKLQAYLDDELSAADRRRVEAWLARDGEAVALLAELRRTHMALAVGERDHQLPESREFYWLQIERGIRSAEQAPAAPERLSWWAAWRRLVIPLGAMAAVVLAGILTVSQFNPAPGRESEMTLADSDAFTYRDYAGGMTLVWLSYPAESESSLSSLVDTLD